MTVSGKLNAQRAKIMKFADGYMISTGEPKTKFVDVCSRNVFMRQGILGIKVRCASGDICLLDCLCVFERV